MGPYYITDAGQPDRPGGAGRGGATRARAERPITSEPLKGTKIAVEVATHVAGTMEFACGAAISIAMSFDVPKHRHGPIELYGTEASLIVPDPNRFGGNDRGGPSRPGLDRTPDSSIPMRTATFASSASLT